MTRTTLACAALAVGLHAFLLWGLRCERPASPLPPAPPSLRVSLVASGPAAAPASAPAPAAAQPASPPAPPTPRAPRKPPKPRERTKAAPRAIAAPAPAPAPPAPVAAPTDGGVPGATAGGAPGERHEAASHGAAGAGGAAIAPRYRSTPEPEYPASARRARQEGVVQLRVAVGANGRPTAVEVAQSSGSEALDRAAVAGVRRWRFDPARRAGLPVAAQVEVPVRFRLDD